MHNKWVENWIDMIHLPKTSPRLAIFSINIWIYLFRTQNLTHRIHQVYHTHLQSSIGHLSIIHKMNVDSWILKSSFVVLHHFTSLTVKSKAVCVGFYISTAGCDKSKSKKFNISKISQQIFSCDTSKWSYIHSPHCCALSFYGYFF